MAEFKGLTVVRWHPGSEPAVKRLDEILMKSYVCIWSVSCWFQIADQDFTTPSCLYQWLVTFVSNEKLGSSHAVRELFKTCCTSSCTLHGLPKSYSHVQLKKLTKPQQFFVVTKNPVSKKQIFLKFMNKEEIGRAERNGSREGGGASPAGQDDSKN